MQAVPCVVFLASAATTMTVVTGVMLLSLANPVDLAEQVATLDVITDGKCVFGAGLGYSEHEFRAFGLDSKAKGPRFEEGLALIKALWSGERVNFKGQFWQVEDALPALPPTRPGGPPIGIAEQTSRSGRRAAPPTTA